MGNKLGRKRQVVDEKYTRPQGLYQHKDVDQKKLRKLILDSKLAPCFPGDDEYCGSDLEECPICYLYYPSLNRSRCCMKGICTECFLQMKTPNSTRPTQCPFCKTLNYAVEYRGVKTMEERGLEQIEEQRVIEAKIRKRQQEVQDEEVRMLKQREISSSGGTRRPNLIEYCSGLAPSFASTIESEDIVASHEASAASAIRLSTFQRQNREGEFDLDLEDIMVMEALWLSIQENGRRDNPPCRDVVAESEEYIINDRCSLEAMAPVSVPSSSVSPFSSSLAYAIAAVAERQQISRDNYDEEMSTYNIRGRNRYYSSGEEQESEIYFPAEDGIVTSPDRQLIMTGIAEDWTSRGPPDMAETGTSYGGYDDDVDVMGRPHVLHQPYKSHHSFQPATTTIIPESFEEQMMLAVAVSLADARAKTRVPGAVWNGTSF